MPEVRLLLTCEHGGNRVPTRYRALFAGHHALLASHRGWDPGALAVARRVASALHADLIAATTTRLLVDLNRSPHNPAVFSKITRGLPATERARLLARHHAPHWRRVRARYRARDRARIVHVGVHSFTPELDGVVRDFDVALLYDPKRARERALAIRWQAALRRALPGRGVRRNAPYRGDSDGLTTALRRELPVSRYLGLELELNQRAIATPAAQRRMADVAARTLTEALTSAQAVRASGRPTTD